MFESPFTRDPGLLQVVTDVDVAGLDVAADSELVILPGPGQQGVAGLSPRLCVGPVVSAHVTPRGLRGLTTHPRPPSIAQLGVHRGVVTLGVGGDLTGLAPNEVQLPVKGVEGADDGGVGRGLLGDGEQLQ